MNIDREKLRRLQAMLAKYEDANGAVAVSEADAINTGCTAGCAGDCQGRCDSTCASSCYIRCSSSYKS